LCGHEDEIVLLVGHGIEGLFARLVVDVGVVEGGFTGVIFFILLLLLT
jgi:hypothetical protein